MYFQLLKKKIDMLSLENIIADIVPNVSNKQKKKIGENPFSGYDFV